MRLGRLYGREGPLRTISDALQEPGALVTLTGLPGSGRTSLSHAAVGGSAAGVPGAAVLEGRRTVSRDALLTALAATAAADVTLVDDVDHVPDARDVVLQVRRQQPLRRLLLTSGTPLGLADEVVVRLAPLPLPEPAEDPEELRRHPAVQLFLDVAARTGTAAQLEDAALSQIAQVCRHLGGLPLAISLVAARAATYSPSTLLDLLARDPHRMLRGRPSGDGDDHDLHAGVALSVSLLTPDQRALLEDLTVFHGPVGIEAVEEVCARPDVVDDLSALVDVHLVEPSHDARGSRFSLPPLVRAYLVGASQAPGPDLQGRHLGWARGIADGLDALGRGGRSMEVREAVAPVEGDLVAALGEALGRGDASAARSLVLALLPLWFSRGSTPEVTGTTGAVLELSAAGDPRGRDLVGHLALAAWHELLLIEDADSPATVERGVARLADLRERARQVDDRILLEVTSDAVLAARYLEDRSVVEGWVAEGRELAERLGDDVRVVRFDTWAGMLAHQRRDIAEAARLGVAAVARSRGLGDPSMMLPAAGLLWTLPPEHRPAVGLPSLDQLVELAVRCKELGVLDWLQPTAAFASLRSGDVETAAEHSAATLRRVRSTGALLRAGVPLLCLFLVAMHTDDLVWAARLRGVLGRYEEIIRPSLPPYAAAVYEDAVDDFEAVLPSRPEIASDLAWGQRLGPVEAVDAALGYAAEVRRSGDAVPDATPDLTASEHPVADRPEHTAELTERERDVLELLAAGGTNREISEQLGISAKTVMHHTSAIYRKLAVRGRAEAVASYLRRPSAAPDPGPVLHLVRGESG